MEPLLVFPDPPPPALAQALDQAGYPWKAGHHVRRWPPASSPRTAGPAPSSAPTTTPRARRPCAGTCASATSPWSRCCCWCAGSQLADLEPAGGPVRRLLPAPAAARRARGPAQAPVLADRDGAPGPELIEYGHLILNLETYQAAIDGRPLDLTYMEYELLKFLATHPGKVFTREMLLSRVWGYEYYGGARTVDVHIRRLRAKLSEEHAG